MPGTSDASFPALLPAADNEDDTETALSVLPTRAEFTTTTDDRQF